MAFEEAGIRAVVKDFGKYMSNVKRMQGATNKFTSSVGKTLRKATMIGGLAIAGIGVAALKMGSDFQTAFAEVTTLFDAPKRQVDELEKGVLSLSSTMGLDAVETTKALYQAISAGVKPADALGFIETNARLAVGGVTDLSTAVDLTTTVMNAWGLQQEELGRVSDVLFATVRAGKTTVDELGASLFQVAPAAAAAGVDIEGVGASLATLTAQGVPTAQAATSLRAAFVELGKEGTKANLSFKNIAGVGFRDFIAQGGDVVGAMEIMQKAAEEEGVAISDLFSAVEGGLAVQVLAGAGFETLKENLDSTMDAAGLTDEAFEKMNATFGRQFTILKSQLKVALIEIGLKILPPITSFLKDTLIPLLREQIPRATAKMKSAWEDLKPVVMGFLRAFKEGLDTLQPVVQALFNFIMNNKVALIAAISAIGIAILLAFGPGAAAIVAIVGLIALIGVVRRNFDEIAAFIDEKMGFIDEVIRAVMTSIKIEIESRLRLIIDTFKIFFALLKGDWGKAWKALKNLVLNQLDLLKQRVDNALRLLKDVFGVSFRDIGNTVIGAVEAMVNKVIAGINKMTSALDSVTGLARAIKIPIPEIGKISSVELGRIRETGQQITSELLIGMGLSAEQSRAWERVVQEAQFKSWSRILEPAVEDALVETFEGLIPVAEESGASVGGAAGSALAEELSEKIGELEHIVNRNLEPVVRKIAEIFGTGSEEAERLAIQFGIMPSKAAQLVSAMVELSDVMSPEEILAFTDALKASADEMEDLDKKTAGTIRTIGSLDTAFNSALGGIERFFGLSREQVKEITGDFVEFQVVLDQIEREELEQLYDQLFRLGVPMGRIRELMAEFQDASVEAMKATAAAAAELNDELEITKVSMSELRRRARGLSPEAQAALLTELGFPPARFSMGVGGGFSFSDIGGATGQAFVAAAMAEFGATREEILKAFSIFAEGGLSFGDAIGRVLDELPAEGHFAQNRVVDTVLRPKLSSLSSVPIASPSTNQFNTTVVTNDTRPGTIANAVRMVDLELAAKLQALRTGSV